MKKTKITKKDFIKIFNKTNPNVLKKKNKKNDFLIQDGLVDSFGIINLTAEFEKITRKKVNISKLKIFDLSSVDSLYKFFTK